MPILSRTVDKDNNQFTLSENIFKGDTVFRDEEMQRQGSKMACF